MAIKKDLTSTTSGWMEVGAWAVSRSWRSDGTTALRGYGRAVSRGSVELCWAGAMWLWTDDWVDSWLVWMWLTAGSAFVVDMNNSALLSIDESKCFSFSWNVNNQAGSVSIVRTLRRDVPIVKESQCIDNPYANWHLCQQHALETSILTSTSQGTIAHSLYNLRFADYNWPGYPLYCIFILKLHIYYGSIVSPVSWWVSGCGRKRGISNALSWFWQQLL